MSVRQIDEALDVWDGRLAAAAQNLLDLQSHPIYKRISAPDANLSGETAEKAAVAVRTISYLLQCFDLLQSAIDRAKELRHDMPAIFGTEEREREIAAVLRGKSIQLPPVQVPFQQRSLLSSIENVKAISPPELLTFMQTAFDDVKQIVLNLESAWESLGLSIEQTAARIQTVRNSSDQLDAGDRIELETAARELEAIDQPATQDPLGPASQSLSAINETIVRLKSKLEQRERERQQLRQALASALNLNNALKSGHEAARAAYEDAREKTGYSIDFESGARKVEGLLAWFERLNSSNSNVPPASVLVGLKNWTSAAQQAMAADSGIVSEAKRRLEARSELRGRFDALKAKARAYSVAEDKELIALADKATTLLYARPTPMEEAASVVSAYESKLNSQTRRSV